MEVIKTSLPEVFCTLFHLQYVVSYDDFYNFVEKMFPGLNRLTWTYILKVFKVTFWNINIEMNVVKFKLTKKIMI